ncbi:iron ABC transporter [Paenibacillus sp. FSL H7-0357]|uniref:ABC transporter permease n=1 Tax=Paenibacillus sp. FSL H7-0357 TaxID=1536774 RepID=UPI0004F71343|nr:iron ABC transporter permease [Paenibacillus sp. FSL H7-0357]AIQ18586.1 iron ABC transporter [Paenibacillus sp. FSL H7-0357]
MHLSAVKVKLKRRLSVWRIVSLAGAAVILLPIFFVFLSIFDPPNENWVQIRQYLVKDYIAQTVQLTMTVAVLTGLLGVTLAWLVAVFDFPGKRFFRWALVLPLAIPPYIAAFTYSTMFSYTGVVQTTLRNRFGIVPDQELITFSSMRGAVIAFTLFLFPYVYLITKSFLEKQSASYIENARLLGRNGWSIYIRIALPLSRPAIAGSVSLVMFEVLSDYGVTSYFGIQTVSTAIFQTWFGMYDADSAMRLAAWLMIIVLGLFFVEMLLRKRRAYSSTTSKSRPLVPRRLTGLPGISAAVFCMIVWCASFLFPLLQLIEWASWTFDTMWNGDFVHLVYQTLSVAAVSTLIIMVFALIVAAANRSRSTASFFLSKAVTAGYSIPGAIIAIGVLVVFLQLDKGWAAVHHQFALNGTPLVLSLTLAMLVMGYVIRFMATGFNAVEVGFEKTGQKFTEASRMLGLGMTKTFIKVDLPLIKGAVMSGCILTFVEICKELPLALILRPFNFETLATKAYRYANDEQIFEASIPSLLIIFISFISVYVMHRLDRKWEK